MPKGNQNYFGKHHSEETKHKMSESHKDYFRRGNKGPMHDKHHSEETKYRMSEAHKRQIPWNKGKTGIFSEPTERNKQNETDQGSLCYRYTSGRH